MDGFVQCLIQERLEEEGTYRFVAEVPIPIGLIRSTTPDPDSCFAIVELDRPAIISKEYVVRVLLPEVSIDK